MLRLHLYFFLAVSIFGVGCAKEQGGTPAGASQVGGVPPAIAVSVSPAVQKQLQESDEFTGRLEATETVDMRSRVAGTIEKVHFNAGQVVRKGELLFTMDSRPFRADLARAEAQLAAIKTQADLANAEFSRAQKLLEMQAISKQEFDQLQSSTKSSVANIRAAESAALAARLNVEYSSIRSPITGQISRANVTAGNLVSNAEPILTTIVTQDKVFAYFDVSESTYLKYVKSSKIGTNPVLMGLANENGYPHKGVIDFVDNRLNPQTGAIRARAVFENTSKQFTPGLFARLKLLGNGKYDAVLTPDRAVGTDQNKKYVLVVGKDNIANFREVKIAGLVGGMRIIAEGLKGDELVVVDGLQRIRPGMPVSPQKIDVDQNGMPLEKVNPEKKG